MIGDFIHNGPTRRQPQFQPEAARDLHEETIQRTDSQAVQIANDFHQQIEASPGIEGGIWILFGEELGEFREFFGIGRGLGQTQHYPIQNFAGGFSGEGGR